MAMILIGQYDSPYVRRVGIALTLYDLPFEHWPWSTFADADRIRRFNPLTRVPTVVLDDGAVLIESHAILDYFDNLMPAERALFPRPEPGRREAMKVAALATGLADKAVSLFYEKLLHEQMSELWSERCRMQMASVLAVLEADRAGRRSDYWFGSRIGHADIAVAVVLRFISEVHPDIALSEFPALKNHAARLEALPAFRKIIQPFIPPR
jgi:glutathione S-transferase